MSERAWFDGLDGDDPTDAAERIRTGSADTPRPWPALAVEGGFVPDESAYQAALRTAALAAFDADLEALAGAADREVVQLVRTLDATRTAEHELRQRVAEAIADATATDPAGTDPVTLREALEAAGGSIAAALVPLIDRLEALAETADDLETTVTQQTTAVAPNLSRLAGPLLAARLIAEAGSLEALARTSSSTMQVLGAEGALFAHLRGEASPPKHGLIFTHPAVRSTPSTRRGAVARTLAGKLTIAARIDHYRGELEPSLEADLAERLSAASGGEA